MEAKIKFIKVYAELNTYYNSIKLRAPANKISKFACYVSVHNMPVMEKLCIEIGILMANCSNTFLPSFSEVLLIRHVYQNAT